MKLFLALFIFSFKAFAEPCDVELYSKYYRLDKNISFTSKDLIKSSTCPLEINNQIVSKFSKLEGEITSTAIEKEIGNGDLHITPRKLVINQLSNFLHDQLTANSNLYFLDLRIIGTSGLISLNEEDNMRVNCESCNTYGEKNIKIEISNPITNSAKAIWISSKLFAKIKVIKAKKTLSFQQKNLSPDDFYLDETFTMIPDNILGSLDNINFYKPNKTILSGSIITNMDLTPVNLVNFGIPVNVSLKNQNINLTKSALPTRPAQFGEVVELKIGNNKTISGKVIDYNKVVIEL